MSTRYNDGGRGLQRTTSEPPNYTTAPRMLTALASSRENRIT